MITKLKLKTFIPVNNGAIQSTYRMLEAHALSRGTMERTEDETLPDLERMKRKLGDRSETFLHEVYEEVRGCHIFYRILFIQLFWHKTFFNHDANDHFL